MILLCLRLFKKNKLNHQFLVEKFILTLKTFELYGESVPQYFLQLDIFLDKHLKISELHDLNNSTFLSNASSFSNQQNTQNGNINGNISIEY